MFASSGAKVNLVEDHEATFTNLKLALLSSKNSLFGDPDFGSLLRRKFFEQDSPLLKDLIIDDIYTTGSTVDALSEAFLENGVKNVYVITLAAGME